MTDWIDKASEPSYLNSKDRILLGSVALLALIAIGALMWGGFRLLFG